MYHNEFQLPGLTLANPEGLIDLAVSEVRMNSVHHTAHNDNTSQSYIRPYALEKAHKMFNSLLAPGKQGISIYRLEEVLHELGLNLTSSDITEIISQLELKDTLDVSFTEAVEIASYIHEQKASHGLT